MSPKSRVAALLSMSAFAFAALPAVAQSDIQWDRPAAPAYDQYRQVPEARYFSPREVESLVAPIALFQDTLVAQILMAATYPYDVEDAADWLSDPRNSRLVGYSLGDALDRMDWDPSVKALTAAPDVLRMMDERRDWTQRLGQAFAADQGMVMDAVQHLRHQARAAGRLYNDRYRRIYDRGGEIVIEPVSASEMYFQFYDPRIAYGNWAYDDFPPYYFPASYYQIVRPISIYAPLWGWSSWDWRARRLNLDVGRWRQLNHNRPHVIVGNTWRHDDSRNRGRDFRGRGDRTNFGGNFNGRPGGRDNDRPNNDRNNDRNDRRDNDGRRDRNPGTSANATPPNGGFYGRGPGLNQFRAQERDGQRDGQREEQRNRGNRGQREEVNATPGAVPDVTPTPIQPNGRQFNGERFNRGGFGEGSRGEGSRGEGTRGEGRGDGNRGRRQEANVNPAPQVAPPVIAQPTPQPDANQGRFGRGGDRGDRGEGRGFQRRQEANVNPTPQADPTPRFRGPDPSAAANAGGDDGRRGGRFGGGERNFTPPAAAPQPQAQPQPQPEAQPQQRDGEPRRFHGRGRGDDPAR